MRSTTAGAMCLFRTARIIYHVNACAFHLNLLTESLIFQSLNIWQATTPTKRDLDLFTLSLLGADNSSFRKGDLK